MRHNIRRANQRFLFGILGMAIVVIMVVALFLVWCMPQKTF